MRYRWFAKDEDDTDEMGIPRSRAFKDMEEPREKNGEEKLFSRGELTSILLTALIMLYGISEQDLPVTFLTVSVLMFMLRRLTVFVKTGVGETISNILKGFSIGLFIGAIILAFI
ncbi:MAG: hypothetical protein IKR28_03225 [Selenomonadaceae bacterium]|nr:hypothetical protein [Selenomonadaceae bacterium]